MCYDDKSWVTNLKYLVLLLRIVGATLILSGSISLLGEMEYMMDGKIPESGRFTHPFTSYALILSGYVVMAFGRCIQIILSLTHVDADRKRGV